MENTGVFLRIVIKNNFILTLILIFLNSNRKTLWISKFNLFNPDYLQKNQSPMHFLIQLINFQGE